MKLGTWLIGKITCTLEPELRDAVVGDVAELKRCATDGQFANCWVWS